MITFPTMKKSEFIKKSKEKFGNDRFQYMHITQDRIHPNSILIITCPIHGDFRTTALDHFNQYIYGGCKKCYNDKVHKHLRTKIRNIHTQVDIILREIDAENGVSNNSDNEFFVKPEF